MRRPPKRLVDPQQMTMWGAFQGSWAWFDEASIPMWTAYQPPFSALPDLDADVLPARGVLDAATLRHGAWNLQRSRLREAATRLRSRDERDEYQYQFYIGRDIGP